MINQKRSEPLTREKFMAKYGKKTQETVEEAMHKYKKGKLKSGKTKRRVKSRKQAIAIALSEARAKGEKVPPMPKKSRKIKRTKRTAKRRKTTRKSKKR